MAEDRTSGRQQAEDLMVLYVCEETGISEEQARKLVRALGMDKSSLIREARELKKKPFG